MNEPTLSPEQQSKLLREMHRALIGNPFNPEKEPGLLKLQTDMHADIYGCEDTKVVGMKFKVERMWDDRIKFLGVCAGVSALAAVVAWVIVNFRPPNHRNAPNVHNLETRP